MASVRQDVAVAARGGAVRGVIAHADRGSQYMSNDYRCKIASLGMIRSVGRTGICWDNAVAEAFWATLKRELVDRYVFATRAEARRAIFAWINYYNRRRLHSSLDYQTPEAWETGYRRKRPISGDQAAQPVSTKSGKRQSPNSTWKVSSPKSMLASSRRPRRRRSSRPHTARSSKCMSSVVTGPLCRSRLRAGGLPAGRLCQRRGELVPLSAGQRVEEAPLSTGDRLAPPRGD